MGVKSRFFSVAVMICSCVHRDKQNDFICLLTLGSDNLVELTCCLIHDRMQSTLLRAHCLAAEPRKAQPPEDVVTSCR